MIPELGSRSSPCARALRWQPGHRSFPGAVTSSGGPPAPTAHRGTRAARQVASARADPCQSRQLHCCKLAPSGRHSGLVPSNYWSAPPRQKEGILATVYTSVTSNPLKDYGAKGAEDEEKKSREEKGESYSWEKGYERRGRIRKKTRKKADQATLHGSRLPTNQATWTDPSFVGLDDASGLSTQVCSRLWSWREILWQRTVGGSGHEIQLEVSLRDLPSVLSFYVYTSMRDPFAAGIIILQKLSSGEWIVYFSRFT